MIALNNNILTRLPRFTDNTPSFNDEGTSTAGWTTENAGLTQPDATTIRVTQTTAGAGNGKAYRSVTMPVANKDWAVYIRARARRNATDAHRFTLQSNTGAGNPAAPRVSVYFNFDSVTSLNADGTISLRYTNVSNVNTNIVVATGVSYDTIWQDFVLYYCSKFNTMTMEFRGTNGAFTYGARVVGSFFGAQLDVVTNNVALAGAYIEWDFITLVSPNLLAIGDSSTAGNTLFSPNPAEVLTNGASRIWQHCPIYTSKRNNYIANKGVGGNTSAQVLARIAADAVDNLPKLVILGACNNDNASISLADRTTNIQGSVTALDTAGIRVMLMNAVYRTAATPPGGQPAYRDYYRDWWTTYRGTLTDVDSYVNPMVVLNDGDDYLDPAYTQADGGHSNVLGYTRRGEQIANVTPLST